MIQYDVHSLGQEGRPGHSKQRHSDHDHVDSAEIGAWAGTESLTHFRFPNLEPSFE